MATPRKAPKARQHAPKARIKAEAPATKPGFFSRAKSAVVRSARAVASFVARPFKKDVRAAIAQDIKAMRTFASNKARGLATRVVRTTRTFWQRALQPLFTAMALAASFITIVVAAVASPLFTAAVLAGTGAALYALSYVVASLEGQRSRAARVGLAVLDVIGQIVNVAFYLVGAFVTLVLVATSWQFGVFVATFLALAWADVPHCASLAALLYFVLSGNWTLTILEVMWLSTRRWDAAPRTVVDVTPSYSEMRRRSVAHADAISVTRTDTDTARSTGYLRAKGTEELWGTEHDVAPSNEEKSWLETWQNEACSACGSRDGAVRLRTQDARHMSGLLVDVDVETSRKYSVDGKHAALCASCYAQECEQNALLFTGVSLRKNSVEVRLNETGITHTAEHAASKFDATKLFWLEIAWWRDRAGREWAREWGCLHDGQVVATVVHDYRRNVYRATVMGKLIQHGVKNSLQAAKRAATDELNDEGIAARRMVERLGEVAETVAPPVLSVVGEV